MRNFLDVMGWILREDGEFMIAFLPAALDGHPRATKYICRRFADMIKHRVQQGKQHDNGKFKKVKKAIKRAMSENR